MNVEQAIRDYLPQIVHMSLGTSNGDQPWVCEVHFAYDDDLNLYFRSMPTRRHSQEIAANPKVAGNIVVQHPNNLAPKGVYFEGLAKRLEADEIGPAYTAIQDRLGVPDHLLEEAKKERHFYKITVSKWYLFDARDTKPAQKFELEWGGR